MAIKIKVIILVPKEGCSEKSNFTLFPNQQNFFGFTQKYFCGCL